MSESRVSRWEKIYIPVIESNGVAYLNCQPLSEGQLRRLHSVVGRALECFDEDAYQDSLYWSHVEWITMQDPDKDLTPNEIAASLVADRGYNEDSRIPDQMVHQEVVRICARKRLQDTEHPERERSVKRYPRPEISANKRAIVYARDGLMCVTCGSGEHLTIDHIHPVSKGGTNDLDNLQTLCRPCNSKKGARV